MTNSRPDVDHVLLYAARTGPFDDTRKRFDRWMKIERSIRIERIDTAPSFEQNRRASCTANKYFQNLLSRACKLRQRELAAHQFPMQRVRYPPRDLIVIAEVITH